MFQRLHRLNFCQKIPTVLAWCQEVAVGYVAFQEKRSQAAEPKRWQLPRWPRLSFSSFLQPS